MKLGIYPFPCLELYLEAWNMSAKVNVTATKIEKLGRATWGHYINPLLIQLTHSWTKQH